MENHQTHIHTYLHSWRVIILCIISQMKLRYNEIHVEMENYVIMVFKTLYVYGLILCFMPGSDIYFFNER
jgi:hypothetical protein